MNISSIKAGATHVAFAASSRKAVLGFFSAALKAGGRLHGEPAIRDPESGYYSAAVLDFDNNSIEVRHREIKKAEPGRQMAGIMENQSESIWRKDVAKSIASNSPVAKSPFSQVVINNLTTPTMMISQSKPDPEPKSDMNTRTLIGTLLGAAAGAAVAYAMTKAEDESQRSTAPRAEYQIIETPLLQPISPSLGLPEIYGRSMGHPKQPISKRQIEYTYQSPQSAAHSTNLSHTYSDSRTAATPVQMGTLIETFVPPSEIARYPPPSIARSHTESNVYPPHSQASSVVSRPVHSSRASSAAQTVTRANFPPSPRSVVTEVRLARELPLPDSRSASIARENSLTYSQSVLSSVAPSDSVSQAGSKKSNGSRRSKHHSSTSDRSRRPKAWDS